MTTKPTRTELEDRLARTTAKLRRAEEAFCKSEKKFNAILDSVADHVCLIDRSLNLLWGNETAKRVFGVHLAGKKCYTVYFGRETPCEQCFTLKTFETGKANAFETRLMDKDGVFRTFYCTSKVATRDENGDPVIVATISQDLTARRKTEETLLESEAALREAQQIAGLGRWELDLQTNILRWSDSIFDIFEMDRSRLDASHEAFFNAVHPDDRESVNAAYLTSLRDKKPYNIEYRLLTPDGRVKWVLEKCRTEYAKDGAPVRSIGVVRDVTERKQKEEALRESEERLRDVLEHSWNVGYRRNLQTDTYDYMSPSITAISGYTPAEMMDMPINTVLSLIHPDDLQTIEQTLSDAEVNDHRRYELEYRFMAKNGQYRWFHDLISIVKDANGRPLFRIGSVRDITRRKRAEELLRKSEAKYRALFDNMAQGVFYKQADGTMTDVNNALLDMFGLTRDEFLERNSMDERWKVIHEDGSEFQGSEHPSMVALRTGLPVRNVVAGIFNPQKNDYVWLNINAIPQFEPGATQPDQAIVTLHDITEIKKAEKAILNHHRYLEAIKEIGALATSTLELKSLLERILDGILNVVGASAGMIFLKDLAAGHLSWGASTGLSDDFVAEYENKTIKPGEGLTGRISEDGEPIFIQQNSSNDARVARRTTIRENLNSFIGVPLRAGKEVIGVMNILSRPPVVLREQDVVLVGAIASHVGAAIQNARLYNQIRETQAALQESERHHRLLIESTMEGYWHVNARFQTLDVNAALCRMLGYTYEEMLAKTPFDVVDDKNRKIFEARASTLLSTKHRSYDIVLQKKNGEKLYANFNATTLPDNSGSFAFVTDITDLKRAEAKLKEYSEHLENRVEARTRELKKAQEELLAKERLAVLGHFAGSVSHELRNPLAAIDAAVYLLNMKLKNADASIGQCLAGVSNNVKKSTAIIQSLLNLSRMEKPKTDAVDAEELIATALESAKVPKTVEVLSNPPEDPVFLRIDPEQVRMAIKNIVQNAVQAMEDAGKITISVHSQEPATADIVIADTGPGIAPEHLEKVFEPLFSTKTHGIGFGISITRMIVENHGGTVRAEAPAEGGARFVITLPRSQTYEVLKTS